MILLAGWLTGYLREVVAITLAGYTTWHVVNAWRLFRWLQIPGDDIPESFGLWADIFNTINSLEQRNRKQKAQY